MPNSVKLVPTYSYKVGRSTDHDWFHYIILGDFHVGHGDFLEREARAMVRWIAQRDPATTCVLVTGDMTENVLPSSKGSAFELAIPDPIKQIEAAVDILKPIKHLIVAGCDGNHSYRSRIASGHSPDKEIFEKLGLERRFLGYSGYHRIKITDRNGRNPVLYTVWAEHGSRNANTVEGKVRILRSMMQSHQMADLYAMGHIHTKLAITDRVIRIQGNKEEVSKVMFASNGSYLFDPEYARRGGYIHGGPGVAKVQFSTRRKDIHCSI